MPRKTIVAVLLLSLFVGLSASALELTELPPPDAPLHARIAAWEELLKVNHMHDGIVQAQVIFPPAGVDEPLAGNHEDATGRSAVVMTAYAFKYAVTKDPADKAMADEIFEGLLNLEKVTGVPGVVGRSLYKADTPLWIEEAYFFPQEWHASKTMPGYRWLGDLSSDKFTDLFYGMGVYSELAADDEQKQRAADFLDRFVGRCIDYNFKLVDVDNKMTLWGNFCPDLPHEHLNAMEMLAGLKTTYKLTGKDRYRAAYHMLIDRYGYDDEVIMSKTLWPVEWSVPWDDNLATKSYWMLMRYETDPSLLQKYRMGLNRHYFAWQRYEFNYPAIPWYFMVYQVLTGENVLSDRVVAAIKDMKGGSREMRTFTIPSADGGTERVESMQEELSHNVLRNYWFGRLYGLIDPSW